MKNSKLLYEKMNMLNMNFPVVFHHDFLRKGDTITFPKHWHEKIEFLYIVKGKGHIICNTERISIKPEILVVINSNFMHEGIPESECVEYYCIIIDNLLFKTLHTDICEEKYINPIYQSSIIFESRIENDIEINNCFKNIIKEYEYKNIGFELSVKSYIYRLLVLLLRNYIYYMLTPCEYDARIRNLDRINNALEYIDKNYDKEIEINELCDMAKLSKYHFIHIFKKITGKSVIEYINYVRINKAESMLKSSRMNVTEIAFACGFNDANYFSRIFKKYKNKPPTQIRQ